MRNKIYNLLFLLFSLIIALNCQSSIVISSNSQRNNRNNSNNIQTNNIRTNNTATNNITTNQIQTNTASTIQIAYQYQLTERGKVLIVPENILFEQNGSRVNTDRYGRTIIYVSSLLGVTNIMNIIVEGHIDSSGRERTNALFYNLSKTNDILYLYNERSDYDLSYLRAKTVSSYLTNVMKTKLIDIGVQNLINPYEDDALNRRVEFIIIENSNDINIYNNYFRNN
ncbi:hypothetical protein [Brachyspira catarrhinii]|uniref:OmpA family protein n=1 Tax=Brachyspira catarrhinii TaxID=2528966 RepID=A0ABY2TRX8_9SPIR|nr:hypothetical protein [Brachyspira catarrhinii]TKZ35539.1 hypothetical protein EZH24_04760 [Brachyspira catarrhinii]